MAKNLAKSKNIRIFIYIIKTDISHVKNDNSRKALKQRAFPPFFFFLLSKMTI
ncbi:hypothetical protein GPK94_03980 [Pseudoflavonifractor sp. MCC625]|nr:hypothetical protein [Pseudoflavonifractor sp. MCC625]